MNNNHNWVPAGSSDSMSSDDTTSDAASLSSDANAELESLVEVIEIDDSLPATRPMTPASSPYYSPYFRSMTAAPSSSPVFTDDKPLVESGSEPSESDVKDRGFANKLAMLVAPVAPMVSITPEFPSPVTPLLRATAVGGVAWDIPNTPLVRTKTHRIGW